MPNTNPQMFEVRCQWLKADPVVLGRYDLATAESVERLARSWSESASTKARRLNDLSAAWRAYIEAGPLGERVGIESYTSTLFDALGDLDVATAANRLWEYRPTQDGEPNASAAKTRQSYFDQRMARVLRVHGVNVPKRPELRLPPPRRSQVVELLARADHASAVGPAHSRWRRTACLLLAGFGITASELLALQWSDVFLPAALLPGQEVGYVVIHAVLDDSHRVLTTRELRDVDAHQRRVLQLSSSALGLGHNLARALEEQRHLHGRLHEDNPYVFAGQIIKTKEVRGRAYEPLKVSRLNAAIREMVLGLPGGLDPIDCLDPRQLQPKWLRAWCGRHLWSRAYQSACTSDSQLDDVYDFCDGLVQQALGLKSKGDVGRLGLRCVTSDE